jgi:hypothetical protein
MRIKMEYVNMNKIGLLEMTSKIPEKKILLNTIKSRSETKEESYH